MNRINVLGVKIDDLTREEAVERALKLIGEHRSAYMVTPNPEIVMAAWESEAVSTAVNNADLVIPDGIGVVFAAKLLKTPLKERLPGIDIAADILERLNETGGSAYILGGRPGVAARAAANVSKQYPRIRIAGSHDGYFSDSDEVRAQINASAPDFVLVCLGASRQELWMAENAGKLNAGLMAGLGGTVDVLSGDVKRAPVSWQKLNLEWLYRCIEEPSRFVKTLKFPHFVLKALREGMKDRNDG